MISPGDYFDLQAASHAELFTGVERVWETLDRIRPFIEERIEPNIEPLKARYGDFVPRTVVLFEGELIENGFTLSPGDATKDKFGVEIDGRPAPGAVVIYGGACFPDDRVELSPGVVVETGAVVKGPTIVGPSTEVRQGAYVRGSCLIGRRCVVGHVTELKNAVFLDEAKAGHFAYVGDSVLGLAVNLGAGTKLANLKLKPSPTRYRIGGEDYLVDRRKFGAIVGDGTEIGCNTVTNPGCLIGPKSLISPNTTVPATVHHARSIIRSD